MRDVPKDSKPADLSVEAVARWLHGENHAYIRDTLGECGRTWDAASPDERTGEEVRNVYRNLARAALALVREKVREAVRVSDPYGALPMDEIIALVMRDKEVKRG